VVVNLLAWDKYHRKKWSQGSDAAFSRLRLKWDYTIFCGAFGQLWRWKN